MEDARFTVRNFEPSLEGMLADPIVQQLMHRDGVTEESVHNLMRQIAAARTPPKLRLENPLPDIGRKTVPQASIGVLAQTSEPRWPRVFPSL